MSEWYDVDGNPISMERWGQLLREPDYQRRKLTPVAGHRVSTIWLGLNHNHFGGETPLIFETMVFEGEDHESSEAGWSDLYCCRYATEAEALAGHDLVVDTLREGGVERLNEVTP